MMDATMTYGIFRLRMLIGMGTPVVMVMLLR